jgi:hypothetical protein
MHRGVHDSPDSRRSGQSPGDTPVGSDMVHVFISQDLDAESSGHRPLWDIPLLFYFKGVNALHPTGKADLSLDRVERVCSQNNGLVLMNKRCNLHHPNRLFLQGRKSISECVFEALFHWSRVSSNDTSACCQHLVSQVVTRVSSRDTSACYHHLVSSIDTSTFVTREFERHVGMLSSSCDSSRPRNP